MQYIFQTFLGSSHRNIGTKIDESYTYLWQEILKLIQELQPSDFVPRTNDKNEARRLNRLHSKYWLLISFVELLSQGSSNRERDSIVLALSALKEQKYFLFDRLQPLKKQHYKPLHFIQKVSNPVIDVISFRAFSRSRQHDKVEYILSRLDQKHIKNYTPEDSEIQDFLNDLGKNCLENQNIHQLYQIFKLSKWISLTRKQTAMVNSNIYEQFPIRAWSGSDRYHIPQGCVRYPTPEQAEEREGGIDYFRSEEEAKASPYNRQICGDCAKVKIKNQ
ncbi:MAG: hypothetical protein AB4290_04945 [Spirulina sp.]